MIGGLLARIILEACLRDDAGELTDLDEMVEWCMEQLDQEAT